LTHCHIISYLPHLTVGQDGSQLLSRSYDVIEVAPEIFFGGTAPANANLGPLERLKKGANIKEPIA